MRPRRTSLELCRIMAAVFLPAACSAPQRSEQPQDAGISRTMSAACLALGQQYADEVHGYALWCDPTASNPCGAKLPTIVYVQFEDGGLEFDGLSSSCFHAVNPARTDGAV